MLADLEDECPQRHNFAHATVGSRLVDVNTTEIIWVASYTSKVRIDSSGAHGNAIAQAARTVAAAFPSR